MHCFYFDFIGYLLTTLEKPVGENQKPLYEYGGEFSLQSADGQINLVTIKARLWSCTLAFELHRSVSIVDGNRVQALQKLTPEERELCK